MGKKTTLIAALLLVILALAGTLVLRNSTLRTEAKVLLGLEAPPQITPLAVVAPAARTAAPRPTVPPPATVPAPTIAPAASVVQPTSAATATATAPPTATSAPSITATPGPVEINGRIYDAYVAAAVKESQLYQYTCEFDAAWVVLQTFGIDVGVDEIIARTPFDTSVEPYFRETSAGFVIYGGDIRSAFAGNYQESFLARSTGGAIVPVFESFGLTATPVGDRAGVEAALRRGALVWMKTTVDFKPWRPATWITPDGSTIQTVLGNDHAVVAIGFNSKVVAIRDVLGPTSSNWRRPLEYEVSWETFMAAWGAQSFDGLAVDRASPLMQANDEQRGAQATYLGRLRSLPLAARWYLLHAALLTGTLGISALFYNLLIDALGYERIFLGRLETTSRLAALGLLIPLWWLVHRIGLRQALMLSAGLQAFSALLVALWPAAAPLLLASGLTGPAAVLFQVSAAPLMMAHSSGSERDYLFSVNAALNIGVAGLSKWLGSMVPGLLALPLGVAAESALAYRATFAVVGLLLLAALLPLLLVPRREPISPTDEPQQTEDDRGQGLTNQGGGNVASSDSGRIPLLLATIARRVPEPWRSIASDPLPLLALLLPPLIISLGAALLIPYLNIFLAERHAAPNATLGLLLAGGDIAAGLAMLSAPLLAVRLGKIGAVAFAQLCSVPFLLLAGWAPGLPVAGVALVLRSGLFNLGVPLYDAFAMERSPAAARPVVIGLVNGVYASGYLVAPLISTRVQQLYGFGPLFAATACCYTLAALVMFALFGWGNRSQGAKD